MKRGGGLEYALRRRMGCNRQRGGGLVVGRNARSNVAATRADSVHPNESAFDENRQVVFRGFPIDRKLPGDGARSRSGRRNDAVVHGATRLIRQRVLRPQSAIQRQKH